MSLILDIPFNPMILASLWKNTCMVYNWSQYSYMHVCVCTHLSLFLSTSFLFLFLSVSLSLSVSVSLSLSLSLCLYLSMLKVSPNRINDWPRYLKEKVSGAIYCNRVHFIIKRPVKPGQCDPGRVQQTMSFVQRCRPNASEPAHLVGIKLRVLLLLCAEM